MNKKALIVGISKYGNELPELPASETEAEMWKDFLIEAHEFTPCNIRMLCSPRATRMAILERLEWLLANAEGDDQLVFVFAGHGARLTRRNPNGAVHDENDEALVAYPVRDDRDIAEYSIYDDDLARLVLLSRVPTYTDITFILDCCYSGGVTLRELDQERIFIPRDLKHRAASNGGNSLRFGDVRRLPSNGQNPVALSAVPPLVESQLTDNFENRWRTVFGYYTLKCLWDNPYQSYQSVRDEAASRMLTERNITTGPVLTGNEVRFQKPFLY